MVEASGRGVVWGIGYDGTAWVYTGGYGGGHLQGEGIPQPRRQDRSAPCGGLSAFPCSLPLASLPTPGPMSQC